MGYARVASAVYLVVQIRIRVECGRPVVGAVRFSCVVAFAVTEVIIGEKCQFAVIVTEVHTAVPSVFGVHSHAGIKVESV